jgi:hypothetical protein
MRPLTSKELAQRLGRSRRALRAWSRENNESARAQRDAELGYLMGLAQLVSEEERAEIKQLIERYR